MKKSDVEAQQDTSKSTSLTTSGSESTTTTATSSGLSVPRTNGGKQVKFLDPHGDDDEMDDDDEDERRSHVSDFHESDSLLRRKSSSSMSRKFSAVGTPEFNQNVIESSNSFAEALHHDQDQFLSNKFEVFCFL